MKKYYDALEIRNINVRGMPHGVDPKSGEYQYPMTCHYVNLECNLKCKLCCNRIAYFTDPPQLSLDDIKKDASKYFQLADYTLKYDLGGGEPQLRADLPEIVDYFSQFRRQIGRFRIVTNGTIIPSDNLVEALRQFGKQAEVMIDRYAASKNADKISEKLSEAGIYNFIRNYTGNTDTYMNGWVSYGDPTLKRDHMPWFCNLPITTNIVFGKVYPCCIQSIILQFNKDAYDDNEMVDLRDDSLDLEASKRKFARLFGSYPFSACNYCNGRDENSQRFAPAEQLSASELQKIRRTS